MEGLVETKAIALGLAQRARQACQLLDNEERRLARTGKKKHVSNNDDKKDQAWTALRDGNTSVTCLKEVMYGWEMMPRGIEGKQCHVQ